MTPEANLQVGEDFRQPQYRQEVFLRFYQFHLKHRAHPGCVYALLPWLRERFDWDDEQALWFAFLNGNTQNPVTSLLLHQHGDTPAKADSCVSFWNEKYGVLAWDTDRRYHKKNFGSAVKDYVNKVGTSQHDFWSEAREGGWPELWNTASELYSFGRLSTWSYLEYLYIFGYSLDADSLMLSDRSGSRSHRNGLCIVTGLDEYDWHQSNPSFDGQYGSPLLADLTEIGDELLVEAKRRTQGTEYERDTTLLTLESALCTYKSWHRPNRRYAGVYIDMFHDRIKLAEQNFGPLPLWWEAREQIWPNFLLIEHNPGDPGVHKLKQNWYRLTGDVPVLGHEDPVFWNEFDRNIAATSFGMFR